MLHFIHCKSGSNLYGRGTKASFVLVSQQFHSCFNNIAFNNVVSMHYGIESVLSMSHFAIIQ